MIDGESQAITKPSKFGLPIRTSFAWRPSLYPPSDINIWSPSFVNRMTFNDTSQSPLEVLVVFIPGNPGLVDFYDEFLEELYNRLHSRRISSQVICAGHVGLSSNNSNTDLRYLDNFCLQIRSKQEKKKVYANLQDQIDYHQDFVAHLATQIDFRKTKLFVLGHSIGGYIANKVRLIASLILCHDLVDWDGGKKQVLEKHRDFVSHVINLFGTISHVADTKNGQALAPLFWKYTLPFAHCFQFMLALIIPRAIMMSMVILFTTITQTTSQKKTISAQNLVKATNLILNFNTFAAAVIIGREEMEVILDLDEDFIRLHRDRLFFYWTKPEADHWIHERDIEKIVGLLDQPPTEIHTSNETSPMVQERVRHGQRWERSLDEIPHVFCLGE